jgi:hypothetical protein
MWHAWGRKKVYKVLVGKPEGKRPLGRPGSRWECGVKVHRREMGWEGVGWVHLAQDRDRWRAVMNAVMNLWVLVPRRQFYNVKVTFEGLFAAACGLHGVIYLCVFAGKDRRKITCFFTVIRSGVFTDSHMILAWNWLFI